MTIASIHHTTRTNILIPLKDVKHEGDLDGCLFTPPRTWTLEDGFCEMPGVKCSTICSKDVDIDCDVQKKIRNVGMEKNGDELA